MWSSLIDGVHGATASPEAFLDVFDAAWPHETNSSILTRVAAYAEHRVVPYFVPREQQDAALARLDRAGAGLLERATPGTTESLAAARLVAGTSDDETLLRAWADGKGLPAGLEDDGDFRWIVVRNLASRGLRRRRGHRRLPRQGRHPAGRPQRAHVPCQPAPIARPRPGRGSS